MVKVVVLIRRNPAFSREEFARYYEETHAPLTQKHSPTLRKYVRNHVTTLLDPPDAEELDCISELWFDDMAGFEAFIEFYMSEAGRIIRDDEDSFQDSSKRVAYVVEEKMTA